MISGMYMGEIVRRILVKLGTEKVLFNSMDPSGPIFSAGLSTAFVSQILRYSYEHLSP